jgi:hypothetical protein
MKNLTTSKSKRKMSGKSVRELHARFEERARGDADATTRKQTSQHVRIDWQSIRQRYDGPRWRSQMRPVRHARQRAQAERQRRRLQVALLSNQTQQRKQHRHRVGSSSSKGVGHGSGAKGDVLGEMRARRSTYTNVLREISENVHLTTDSIPAACNGAASS